MPRTSTVLRIFVASPSDLNNEREILDEVIKELNLSWSQQLGVSLELVKWETHASPSIGTDPQSIIDSQIFDYDIFLALFWTRIGTPTPRYPSGTIEEFELAHKKWRKDPSSIRIMVYFKTAPVSPNQIDPEQLLGIQQFQNTLSKRGVLYFTFATEEEFSQLVRIHLSKQVQDFLQQQNGNLSYVRNTTQQTPTSSQSNPSTEIEDGFLDLIETSVTEAAEATDVMRNLGEAIGLLNNQTTETTKEINAVSGNSDFKLASYKRLINQQADNMSDFTRRMKSYLPVLENSYSKSLNAYGKMISLLPDFGNDEKNQQQLKQALDAASGLKETIVPFNANLTKLHSVISSMPRITTQFNHAKRDLLIVLDEITMINNRAVNLINEIETAGKSIMKSWNSHGNAIQ